MSAGRMIGTSAYVVLRGERSRYNHETFNGVKVDRVRTRKPSLGPDEIAVRIVFNVPAAIFEQPSLSATLTIDGELAITPDAVTVQQVQP